MTTDEWVSLAWIIGATLVLAMAIGYCVIENRR